MLTTPVMTPSSSSASPAAAARSLPLSLHLELLKNVSERDAQEYANGFVLNRTVSSQSSFGVFEFADGYIVEVQEGGDAKAYTPALLTALEVAKQAQAVPTDVPLRVRIQTAKHDVYVSITPDSLSSMVMVAGCDVGVAYTLASSNVALKNVDLNHGRRFLRSASVLFLISLGVLGAAAILRPSGNAVSITQVKAESLPLAKWVNELTWPADERPVTVRFEDTSKRWTVETQKADKGLTLKKDSPATAGVAEPPVLPPAAPGAASGAPVAPTSSATPTNPVPGAL